MLGFISICMRILLNILVGLSMLRYVFVCFVCSSFFLLANDEQGYHQEYQAPPAGPPQYGPPKNKPGESYYNLGTARTDHHRHKRHPVATSTCALQGGNLVQEGIRETTSLRAPTIQLLAKTSS